MSELRLILLGLTPLLVTAFLMIMGNGLFGTLLSVRMDLEGMEAGSIGAVLACYSVGFIAGARFGPVTVERVGHIRTYAAFAAVTAATALFHQLLLDALLWAILRIIAGFAMACLYMIVESWLNAMAPNAMRGRVMSAYMTVNYLAFGLSQYLLALTSPATFVLFSLVAVLIALSIVPLTLSRVEAPPSVSSERLGLRQLIALSPLGVAGCFAGGMLNGTFSALGPVYARAIDGSTLWVAQFMMAAIFGGFLLQFPMGRLSDRFDRRHVILWLTIAIALGALVMTFLSGFSITLFVALLVLYGGISYTLYPLSLSHANDFMDSGHLVPAAAGLLFYFGIGAVIGPLIAGQLMNLVGPSGLFLQAAAIGSGLALFTLWRMRVRPARRNEEQGPFIAVPQTTATVSELDPRNEPEDEQLELAFDAERGA